MNRLIRYKFNTLFKNSFDSWRIAQRSPDNVLKLIFDLSRKFDCERRFADAAHTDNRDNTTAIIIDPALQREKFLLPAKERFNRRCFTPVFMEGRCHKKVLFQPTLGHFINPEHIYGVSSSWRNASRLKQP